MQTIYLFLCGDKPAFLLILIQRSAPTLLIPLYEDWHDSSRLHIIMQPMHGSLELQCSRGLLASHVLSWISPPVQHLHLLTTSTDTRSPELDKGMRRYGLILYLHSVCLIMAYNWLDERTLQPSVYLSYQSRLVMYVISPGAKPI